MSVLTTEVRDAVTLMQCIGLNSDVVLFLRLIVCNSVIGTGCSGFNPKDGLNSEVFLKQGCIVCQFLMAVVIFLQIQAQLH